MFQLANHEVERLRSQVVNSKPKVAKHIILRFLQIPGVCMLFSDSPL